MLLLRHSLALVGLALLATVPGAQSKRQCTKFVTYNANMQTSYHNHTERRIRVPKDLGIVDADIYCLQSYWNECDMELLVEQVQHKYPYHFSEIHEDVDRLKGEDSNSYFPCTQAQVDYFKKEVIKCADENGCRYLYNQNPVYGRFCLASHCTRVLTAERMSANCFGCITRFINSPFDDNITRCVRTGETCNKYHNPSGLVLLSKRRIESAEYKSFHTGVRMTYQRGYLQAEVSGIGTVVCTQLTEVVPLFLEYDSEFDNYEQQQYDEISNLIRTFGSEDHYLLGEFSIGPAVEEHNVTKVSSAAYDRLLKSGYSNPYVEADGQCTFCTTSGFNALVDHIFIKGQVSATAKRVFDEIQAYRVEGKFGVQVQVCENIDEENN